MRSDSIFDIELFNKKRNGGSKLRRWKKYIGKVLHSALKLEKHFLTLSVLTKVPSYLLLVTEIAVSTSGW